MTNLYARFEWRLSSNANKTCNWNLLNATIFPHGAGFKYVVNVDGADRDTASFSKHLPTEAEATKAAEALMWRLADEYQASRR